MKRFSHMAKWILMLSQQLLKVSTVCSSTCLKMSLPPVNALSMMLWSRSSSSGPRLAKCSASAASVHQCYTTVTATRCCTMSHVHVGLHVCRHRCGRINAGAACSRNSHSVVYPVYNSYKAK